MAHPISFATTFREPRRRKQMTKKRRRQRERAAASLRVPQRREPDKD